LCGRVRKLIDQEISERVTKISAQSRPTMPSFATRSAANFSACHFQIRRHSRWQHAPRQNLIFVMIARGRKGAHSPDGCAPHHAESRTRYRALFRRLRLLPNCFHTSPDDRVPPVSILRPGRSLWLYRANPNLPRRRIRRGRSSQTRLRPARPRLRATPPRCALRETAHRNPFSASHGFCSVLS